MTQTPQPNEGPAQAPQGSDAEAPAPSFTPIIYEPVSARPSRKLLIFAGVAVVVMALSLVLWPSTPDTAEAEGLPLDVANMTATQLAEDASPAAARELARRMIRGTMEQQKQASLAISQCRSPRLARNLAMAMALENQKKQQQMMLQAERQHQELMESR